MPRGGSHYVKIQRDPDMGGVAFLSPAQVFGAAWHDGTWNQPKAAPAPVAVAATVAAPVPLDPVRELRCAEAAMCDAVRVYDFARHGIGEANRTVAPAVLRYRTYGDVIVPAARFRPERIRERRAAAFRLFNQRRAELFAARRRLDAARLALGLPLDDAAARLVTTATSGRA